ncbi:L,D-transpeptidase family protein [Pedobacter psychroterrae]|uniref:Murein L,D-transpeptidase n=1 Tax=Pedobacter psychroterrae TaxID=2530453 RepID=A0A4R0NL83_9SPHI|nr:L,D-transpeptidase family protein [Pedobacter psychroterrae]TCD01521.1 murein L,D-transpeptidase [Pedobacter psychroterrae]
MNTTWLKLLWLLLINFSFSLISCGQSENKHSLEGTTVRVNIGFDSTQINVFFEEYPKLKRYRDDLWSFYSSRDFSYAWFQDGRLVEQAGNLTNRILNLKDDGVYKQLSYAGKLDSLTHEEYLEPTTNIKLELLLTAEYFVFSSLVWEGMETIVSKSNNWFLPRKKIAYGLYLDSLLRSPVYELSAKEPVYRQYELLKSYLRKYRDLDALVNWEQIGGDSKDIAFTDAGLVTSQVKTRLLQLEDYRGKLQDTLFDAEFSLALVRFQQRHGLDPSGKINKETLGELNVPIRTRIQQILVNMERSRWLPVTSEGDYIAVNIPEFKMHVYHADSLLWSCNAVVGQTVHPTTLFYGEINQVVFSPYWNIPEGIVAKEILPGVKRDPKYLSRHNMEITGQRNGLPVVRQKPGPSNSLGLVKFLFPNSYSIYLHDTPSKSLFNETYRAFSHGCVRIEQPAKLAAFLLRDNPKWSKSLIRSAMHSGKERYVPITKKVPVFIAYLTAFIDRENRLNFRKDIYNLDSRLAAMIISGDASY